MSDRYKPTVIKTCSAIILYALIFSAQLSAGLWYEVYQDLSFEKINDVTNFNDLHRLYAVGDNGAYYHSYDGGFSWDMSVPLTPGNLNCIEFLEDSLGGDDYVLIAAGDNGAVFIYSGLTSPWQAIDSLGMANFNASCNNYGTIWLGGDHGVLYSSGDAGLTWNDRSLADENMDIKVIVRYAESVFFVAVKNDTSFLLDDYSTFPIDTIPGVEIFSSAELSGSSGERTYFLGRDVNKEDNSIWLLDDSVGLQFTQIYSGDFYEATSIGGYGKQYGVKGKVNKTTASDFTLWITSINGYIWESTDDGANWKVVYTDHAGRGLYKVLGIGYDHDFGRAFGEEGLVLKQGFDLRYTYPGHNQSFPSAFQQIELVFSHTVNMQSIYENVVIYSKLSGYLPFTATYDLNDSTRIFLELKNPDEDGYIPGDSWNISLGPGIIPLDYDTTDFFKSFNFDIFLEAPHSSNFTFAKSALSSKVNRPTTNYVSALLDQDNVIDLVTYSQDSLHVYSFSPDMSVQKHRKVFLGDLIQVDSNLERQLLTTDVNNDARPDIILHDSNHLVIYINKSSPDSLIFEENSPLSGEALRRVAMFNGNNNGMPDMAVLDYTFNSHMDISDESYGDYRPEIEPTPQNYSRFDLADLDRDGIADMVLLNPNGQILFWRGNGGGHFDVYTNSITTRNGYYEIKTADLDGDGELEVLALDGQRIDVYTLQEHEYWTFYQTDAWGVQSEMQINNFAVRDLGGSRHENQNPVTDIVIITSDSLIFYNNQTMNRKQFSFTKMTPLSKPVGIAAEQLVIADFNMDAFPDVAVIDKDLGQYEIFTKVTWKPQIVNFSGHRHNMHLEWDAPPPEFGNVDHYRVFRDSVAEIQPFSYSRQTSDTFFDDHEVDEIEAYWYAVQAVYENGVESGLSDPVYIENFIALNDNLTADLDDSTRYYLAQSNLIVPQDQTISVHPGVRVIFMPETGLDVYGQLQINGNGEDNQMIEFFGYHHDAEYIPWKGIHVHSGEDTLFFEWFSISGANNGIFVDDRPLKMRYAGIVRNEVGLEVKDDSLAAGNMIFDSNMVAIKITGEARVEMRNINIMRSENSIVATNNSRMNLRNAIIWENMQPVLCNEPSAQINVRYSTVDSLASTVIRSHVSRIAPLFMPPDSGEYRPAYLSTTIDAGDPADDFSQEPMPNGGRINQGVFGGFFMATPSYQPRISVFPKNIMRSAFPGTNDTSQIFIKNAGYTALTISSINLPSDDNIFQFNAEFPAELPPNDSMAVRIIFRPQERITYLDTLFITNNDPHVVDGVTRFALQGAGLNSAPQVINEPVRNARGGELYQYQILASDADGDTLFYSPGQLPAWLTLSPTGLLSGTPTNDHTGLNDVQIVISDPFEASALLEYNILVTRAVNNYIPDVLLTPLNNNIIRQAAVRFTFDVQDSTSEVMTDKRLRYSLVRVSTQDTLILVAVDTTIIDRVDFYPLQDGLYRFKVWAYRISMGERLPGLKTETSWFSIAASKRTVLPYRWHMVSFPRQEPMQWSHFGYGDSSAILLRWNQEQEEYENLNREEILPGNAFWAMPFKALEFDLNDFNHSVSHGGSVAIHKGWNQVGIPIGYSLYWSDMHFYSQTSGREINLQEAITDSLLNGTVYRFSQDKNFQGYHWEEVDSNTVAWPWTGYWIKANEDGMLIFSSEPAFENQKIATTANVLAKSSAVQEKEWKLNIALETDKYCDAQNIIGLSDKTQNPVFEPPHMGEFCALYFPSKSGRLTKDIKTEFKSDEEVKTWNIRVTGRNLHTEHFIKWDNGELQNGELYLYLVDETNETVVKMNEESEYGFSLKSEEMRFKIYASQDESFRPEIIPLQFKLAQNFPNPFNPRTTIRFGLPESAAAKKVELNIYNVLGKKVVTLINGALKAGYHEVEWNGYNTHGRQVASGIYFYQIRSGSVSIIKKMILVR